MSELENAWESAAAHQFTLFSSFSRKKGRYERYATCTGVHDSPLYAFVESFFTYPRVHGSPPYACFEAVTTCPGVHG